MTGAAVVNSPHAFQCIRDLFVEKYLNPQPGKLPSHNMKLAWQTLAMCKAALEIHHGDKMSTKQIHVKMWDKYVAWANIIRDEADCGIKINEKPDYLSEVWFMTADAKHQKPYVKGAVSSKRFWKKWGIVKSTIINSDNHVVKRTIASMPGGALPSGTDWSIFLTRLIYNMYIEKEKMKPKKVDTDDGLISNLCKEKETKPEKADIDEGHNDNVNKAGVDEIGGSVAKKAGPSVYCTADSGEINSSEGSAYSRRSSESDDAESCDGIDANDDTVDANDDSETNKSGKDHDDEHDEPTAPDTFFPTTLLVVLSIGVLSDDVTLFLISQLTKVM